MFKCICNSFSCYNVDSIQQIFLTFHTGNVLNCSIIELVELEGTFKSQLV